MTATLGCLLLVGCAGQPGSAEAPPPVQASEQQGDVEEVAIDFRPGDDPVYPFRDYRGPQTLKPFESENYRVLFRCQAEDTITVVSEKGTEIGQGACDGVPFDALVLSESGRHTVRVLAKPSTPYVLGIARTGQATH